MSKLRRRYTREEKLQIVKESVEENVSNEDMGRRYNIHPNTISRWRSEFSQYEKNAFPGNGNKKMTDEQRENEQLRKELRESQLANEILKKALGIISSPNRKNLLS
jgi:transposase